jgi:hypothetical protein
MRKLLYSILAVTFFVFLSAESKAQNYRHAIGGRFGAANGITFKTFTAGNRAWDLIANFRDTRSYSTFRFTALYEIHNNVTNAPGLQWYYGGGGTIGTYKWKPSDENDVYLSADGVLGLDYKFAEAPINVALDWKPAIEITPNTGFDAEGFGLSIRFTF